MSEFGGEIYTPDEGTGGAPEELSEEAKQRFAAAGAAMKQIRKEERKAKKRDDQLAQVIIQFLGEKQHSNLFLLVSRLVARDCPSIFLLAILSLIHDESRRTVDAHLEQALNQTADDAVDNSVALAKNTDLDDESNHLLLAWITRMQMVLSTDPRGILTKLMLDDQNVDGTVLQLTAFVLQEFLQTRGREAPFESVQPLTANILQTVFEPFIAEAQEALLAQAKQNKRKEEEDEDED